MSDAYAWFKFNCASWMMGRIQRLSFAHQGAFIRLCCVYWTKQGNITIEDAELECSEELLKDLLKMKIVKESDCMVTISFMDDLLEEKEGKSKSRKNAANARWKNANALQVHASALQTDANAMQKERKKEREIEEEPSINDFILFFDSEGYQTDVAKTAWQHYHDRDWIDVVGTNVRRSWRTSVRKNWFKEKHLKNSDKSKSSNERMADHILGRNKS